MKLGTRVGGFIGVLLYVIGLCMAVQGYHGRSDIIWMCGTFVVWLSGIILGVHSEASKKMVRGRSP